MMFLWITLYCQTIVTYALRSVDIPPWISGITSISQRTPKVPFQMVWSAITPIGCHAQSLPRGAKRRRLHEGAYNMSSYYQSHYVFL